ncbi:MAG: sialidase family protein, partial [Planctomycetota bacterium]
MRSANRIGNVAEDKNNLIGFRVVIGELPKTKPLPELEPQLYQTNVSQQIPADIAQGPDPEKPYFKGPRIFTHLPDSVRGPLYNKHNHFTSVTECANGDLLGIWHTCITEGGRELGVAASRLRYGSDKWEEASLFWDCPDRNDHGHALWHDGQGKIFHFQGHADLTRNVALVMRTSTDNAATWSKPRVIADHGPSRMPCESVFRTREGFYVLSCDKGPNITWISRDKGLTWNHPGGSLRGKHAPVVQLTDGRLMSLGRQSSIDGMMPKSISTDMGKTWTHSASGFQPVSWGQRAVLLRLKEGPILFISFCKKMPIPNDAGSKHYVSGLYAAVSFDDGQTWPHFRLLTDDGPERDIETLNGELIKLNPHNSESVGYLAICQTPDKLV